VGGWALTAAIGAIRAAWRLTPSRVKVSVEHRFFGAVGHATRVTNDGYPQPAELLPPAGRGERDPRGVRGLRSDALPLTDPPSPKVER
jgi:hypothetical protein